jgi:pilus assembly protein CpaF
MANTEHSNDEAARPADRPLSAALSQSPESLALHGANPAAASPDVPPVTVPSAATPAVPVPVPGAPTASPVPSVPSVPSVTAAGVPSPAGGSVGPSLANGQPVKIAYALAGALTSEQVITGDPDKYRHLDAKITDTVARVQDDLVRLEMADKLVTARYDAQMRLQMTEEIDRLALKHLLSGRGVSAAGETPIIVATVINEIIGLGPLEPLWDDPSITEVIVNGPEDVYVEQKGILLKARGVRFRSQDHLTEICQRILSPLNRKLDVKDPLADGRLPDGSRVNAVHAAIAPRGPLLTIRRFPQVNRSLVDLVAGGAMTEDMACTLTWLVANKASTLVCGGTGTGKTTMLNALSAVIPRAERVVTIEDSLELRLHPDSHVAAMEARPTDASGGNAVPIRSLVKNALRMRPDRIIVGEIRDQAALDMLQACNTGHEGSMSTVHANGPNEAVSRMAVMVAQGGEIPADKVDWLVGSALDLIVMIRRYKDGSRRVSGIYEVPEWDGEHRLQTIPLWEWKRTGEDAETGQILGDYVVVNEISPALREKLALDFEPVPSFDDVRGLVL